MATRFVNTDLLLLGKTGHGKSATGNSILGRRVFETSGNMSSVTNRLNFEVSKVDNRVVMVVDVPGVCDTGENKDEALTDMLDEAIAANPRGYHCLLLVYKYGTRFTQEEQDTFAFLKEKLGNDFIKNHAIVLLTNGDTYESEGNESGEFLTWCRNQPGPFGELLKECSYRAAIFNNKTKDETKLKNQRSLLLSMVDNKLQGSRYDHHIFQMAQKIQNTILRETKKPLVTEEIFNKSSLMMQAVEDVMKKPDEERREEQITLVLNEAEELQELVVKEDKHTGELGSLAEMTQLMKNIISDEKKKTTKDKKSSKSSKTKSATIGKLMKNIQPSQFDALRYSELKDKYLKVKRDYQTNFTDRIIKQLHGTVGNSSC